MLSRAPGFRGMDEGIPSRAGSGLGLHRAFQRYHRPPSELDSVRVAGSMACKTIFIFLDFFGELGFVRGNIVVWFLANSFCAFQFFFGNSSTSSDSSNVHCSIYSCLFSPKKMLVRLT